MTRQSDHSYVVAKIFSAELGANSHLSCELVDFLFPLEITEGGTIFISGGGEVICRGN
jgi:hypothetical protein